MSKTFIRNTAALFVACHYKQPDVDQAISWADALSKRLDERGYGTKSAAGTSVKERVGVDHYGNLNQEQKQLFDTFWFKRFNYKAGKSRAAMAFLVHWDTISEQSEAFLAGAAKEAQIRTTRATVPPQAEKWINYLRWQDHAAPEKIEKEKVSAEKAEEIARIKGDLAHFKAMPKSDELEKIIGGLEAKLKEAMK